MSNKVTADKFGDTKFQEMYTLAATADRFTFMKWCVEAINEYSCSSRVKKDSFIRSIQADRTVDKMMMRLTNIMLAGEGLAVAA